MVKQIAIRGFDNNFSYFIIDFLSREVAIVDPGDVDMLMAELNLGDYLPKMILLTHSHFDHVEGVSELLETFRIPVMMHKNAVKKVDFQKDRIETFKDGSEIQLGKKKVKVLYTPGHIDDAVCYYVDEANSSDSVPKVITGDTLFVEGCGRADLPGGDVKELYKSLQRLKGLSEETEVFPGHDYGSIPKSTIGYEKKHNKYLLCESFEEFERLRMG